VSKHFPNVRGAPDWLIKQREAQRKHQAEHPMTEREWRTFMTSLNEHSFRNSPYYKPSKSGRTRPGKPLFFPVWSTHKTASEGGRKTHLFEASHADKVRSGIRALCRRMVSLANIGDPVTDVEAWAKDNLNEVCKLCYYRATNRMPVRGINGPTPWPRPE
jgi:hypothetical protein